MPALKMIPKSSMSYRLPRDSGCVLCGQLWLIACTLFLYLKTRTCGSKPMLSCASAGVTWRGGWESESCRIVHGGGPSAGFELLAIFVLGEADGSMLGREAARPAKSHGFPVEVMVVASGCYCYTKYLLPRASCDEMLVSGNSPVAKPTGLVKRHRRVCHEHVVIWMPQRYHSHSTERYLLFELAQEDVLLGDTCLK